MSFFDYSHDPAVRFDMYTPMHLLMLGITLLLFVVFFLLKDRLSTMEKEPQIRRYVAYFLIVLEIVHIIIVVASGRLYLPFHLCAISYLLTIVLLLTNNKTVFEFVFYTGLIGGLVTFAIPELDHVGYNRFRFYQFIIAHSVIIMVPLYYLTNLGYRLTKKSLVSTLILVNILGFLMLGINAILRSTGLVEDANYMYMYGPPADVEAIFGTFPWHILSFELTLILSFSISYFIASLYQNKAKQTEKKAA